VIAGTEHRYAVGEGFAEVSNDKVRVLVEEALRAEQIDPGRAAAELKELQAKLASMSPEDPEFQDRACPGGARSRPRIRGPRTHTLRSGWRRLEPANAALQHRNVEIDQQPEGAPRQLHVRRQARAMPLGDPADADRVDDQLAPDDQIEIGAR